MSITAEDTADVQVFTPYKAGLPPVRPYLSQMWQRRSFCFELARSQLRAQHFETALGQVWLIINPLLLTFVYYLLVSIIGGRPGGSAYLAHIMAGLFAYYYFSGSMNVGSSTVTQSGKLIMNTAFPKMLLPVSAVVVSFMRFVPTLVIYFAVHAAAGLPWSFAMLWGLVFLVALTLFSAGMSMITATATVYIRDVRSLLPYLIRIWLYVSPVLWFVDDVPRRLRVIEFLNPLFPIMGGWTRAVVEAEAPTTGLLVGAFAWAFAALVIGGYLIMSREREFAVRI